MLNARTIGVVLAAALAFAGCSGGETKTTTGGGGEPTRGGDASVTTTNEAAGMLSACLTLPPQVPVRRLRESDGHRRCLHAVASPGAPWPAGAARTIESAAGA